MISKNNFAKIASAITNRFLEQKFLTKILHFPFFKGKNFEKKAITQSLNLCAKIQGVKKVITLA